MDAGFLATFFVAVAATFLVAAFLVTGLGFDTVALGFGAAFFSIALYLFLCIIGINIGRRLVGTSSAFTAPLPGAMRLFRKMCSSTLGEASVAICGPKGPY